MKYFTPELLARCRSLDADEAETAAMEWMSAIENYNAYLKAAVSQLSPWKLGHFERLPAMHDWQIISCGVGRDSKALSLLMGGFGGKGPIDILYSPHGEPRVLLPDGWNKRTPSKVFWLYDEFSLDGEVFTHSILFSNGLELQIDFDDFFWETLDPIPNMEYLS